MSFVALVLIFAASRFFEGAYLEQFHGASDGSRLEALAPPRAKTQEVLDKPSSPAPRTSTSTPTPAWIGCRDEWPTPWQAQLPLRFSRDREPVPKAKIPKIVHFVFGYKVNDLPLFTFLNFAAVVSALAVIKPARVMMHFGQEPVGFLWDLVRPHVKLVRGRNVQSIFGNPVEDYAHKADIIRLEALLKHGGIYLDIDVVTLRSFDKLLEYDTVMGEEGVDGKVGLCNGVILAAPGAKFVKEWYSNYRTFNKTLWNFHSVKLPMKIAKKNPGWIFRLPYQKFHWPLWDAPGIKLMMDSFEYDYKKNLAVHVWSHGLLRSPYRNFSMEWCFECHSTLVSKLRSLVPDPLISVVVPCDIHGSLIQESLRSVVEQTFPAWEIVVVVGPGSEACGKAATSFSKSHGLNPETRFRLLDTERNTTWQVSRNFGVRASRGVWICILHPAIRIRKDYFYSAVQMMGAVPDVQLIVAGELGIDGSFWIWSKPISAMTSPVDRGAEPLAALYLRDLWTRVGGYTNALPGDKEDIDFYTKLLAAGVKSQSLSGDAITRVLHDDAQANQHAVEDAEELAMVMSMHPEFFHPARVLGEHVRIMNMSATTRLKLETALESRRLAKEDFAVSMFWLGLADFGQEDYVTAVDKFSIAMHEDRLHWQAGLYHALSVCRLNGSNASVAHLGSLAVSYPSLRYTAAFVRHKRECFRSRPWVISAAAARDV